MQKGQFNYGMNVIKRQDDQQINCIKLFFNF